MRILGFDLGTRTLGISISDYTNTIATTYKTIRFNEREYDSIIPEIKNIVYEFNVQKIVEDNLNIEVIMQDERLTTVQATNYMLEADISRKKRKKKVDSLAANIILQTYLDTMKGRNNNV